jgi:large subunit ribosomal protein L15
MDLSTLKPASGSINKNSKRVGRGVGSGKGRTAARGHKGAKSRSGYSKKLGFEGGQMPLQRRVPKFGFKNINRVEFTAVNLDTIQELVSKINTETIDLDTLRINGLVGKSDLVKVLNRGEIKSKINITTHKISKSAQAAIEAAGGSVTLI